MKWLAQALLVVCVVTSGGCTIKTSATLPQSSYEFHLVDASDGSPVANATVHVVLSSPAGESRRFGPAVSDDQGRCDLVVNEQKMTWTSGSVREAVQHRESLQLWYEITTEDGLTYSGLLLPGNPSTINIRLDRTKAAE